MDNYDSNAQFTFDIRRTLILGLYMQHWGMPEERVVSRKEETRIEVYSFPPNEECPV
ncbi:MAG: hypothetical protein JWM11_1657, partial [Planctomycetaceae bacterium]|nr:hypothetical protein [Planctomycetaceae bacterium]